MSIESHRFYRSRTFHAAPRRTFALTALAALPLVSTLLIGCGNNDNPKGTGATPSGSSPTSTMNPPVVGQSDFTSLPAGGGVGFGNKNGALTAGAADNAAAAPQAALGSTTSSPAPVARKVEETDLYRIEGDRLYYLNSYRGLMVFDVNDIDNPKFLGRSPIYGNPVEMIVRNGIATVVVADWYGKADDGSPFYGSIVRGIDARNPAAMRVTGEAKLGGWVRDTRVVGDVLYAVTEGTGKSFGYEDGFVTSGVGVAGAVSSVGGWQPSIVISSVSFANGVIKEAGHHEFPGYGGVFNVTQSAILLAHDLVVNPSQSATGGQSPPQQPAQTELQYVDITDPKGAIQLRGKATVNGRVQGWGADNGRWNLDFADNQHAHTLGINEPIFTASPNQSYILATANFTNPDAPTVDSEMSIPGMGWGPTARFDNGRMYLAPDSNYYYSSSGMTNQKYPIQIYDLSNSKAPKLTGSTEISGSVSLFMPDGNRLFALGQEASHGNSFFNQQLSLSYLDVTSLTQPNLIGTSTFGSGQGWAWTPAAGTFKAFTKDDTKGLVVLPFSGYDYQKNQYNNGVQLIQFTPTSITTAGAAHTKGWVERGIFVKNRLIALSDLTLSVIDYSTPSKPNVVREVTLARNVVNAQPLGTTIAELSTGDFWGNQLDSSELRVLPIAQASEDTSSTPLSDISLEGVNARVFQNGNFAYVVTNVRRSVDCASQTAKGGPGIGASEPAGGVPSQPKCYAWHEQVQVVDVSGGQAKQLGKVALPDNESFGYYGWGWGGFGIGDWYNGADVVQVHGDALAFRRWVPNYVSNGQGGVYDQSQDALYVVDLSNPDKPAVASTTITADRSTWWGNMRAVGDTLYTTHYEWVKKPDPTVSANNPSEYLVKYYLDQIDLSDRQHPKVGSKINVPGVLVGASPTDPTLLYTIDYIYNQENQTPYNLFDVVKVQDNKAYLQGSLSIEGSVGQVIVQGSSAYMSAEHTSHKGNTYTNTVRLHQIDLSDPHTPKDSPSTTQKGWGWLLAVVGDRAIVTSGWSNQGVDIYKLSPTSPPAYDQFVRTLGWWASSLTRQGNQLFLSSGYWGVQTINLQ